MPKTRVACGLAESSDGIVCLLYVIPVVISAPPAVNPLPISESEARSALSEIAREHVGNKVRYEIYTKIGGEPASEVLRAVEELGADSVVISTHGRKGIGRFILGSVAERVVGESPCPVLTVRAATGK
jgi:nucleotide-binding universal stress UspA family protein